MKADQSNEQYEIKKIIKNVKGEEEKRYDKLKTTSPRMKLYELENDNNEGEKQYGNNKQMDFSKVDG